MHRRAMVLERGRDQSQNLELQYICGVLNCRLFHGQFSPLLIIFFSYFCHFFPGQRSSYLTSVGETTGIPFPSEDFTAAVNDCWTGREGGEDFKATR